MKSTLNLSFLFAFFTLTILSCKKPPFKKGRYFSSLYVSTGNIAGQTFTDLGAFNPNHTALGTVDSCSKLINALKSFEDTVYIFSDKSQMAKVIVLQSRKLLQDLKNAQWTQDYTYTLANDAMVCKDGYVFYTRQKEDSIKRYQATVYGATVYKFKDELYKEDYESLKQFHNYLNNTVNLYTVLGINKINYSVNTGRSNLLFNTALGFVNKGASSPTPLGDFDKLKITPIGGIGQKYLFRYFLHPVSAYSPQEIDSLKKYFPLTNSQIDCLLKNRQKEPCPIPVEQNTAKDPEGWKNYLKNEVYPKYFPTFIEGYKCACGKGDLPNNLRTGFMPVAPGAVSGYSPPLPLQSN